MEIKFEASKEELAELAKMVYIAHFVVSSSGKFGLGYKYPLLNIFNAADRVLNKMLLQYIPESGLVEVDEQSDNIFTHTMQMEKECEAILNENKEDGFLERVCNELTNRDFIELYDGTPDSASRIVSDVYQVLYDSNEKELKEHRLKRLKVVG